MKVRLTEYTIPGSRHVADGQFLVADGTAGAGAVVEMTVEGQLCVIEKDGFATSGAFGRTTE